MKCVAHYVGLEHECRTVEECNNGPAEPDLSGDVLDTSDLAGDQTDSEDEEEVERRTYKDPSTYVDQNSTGRKQAARWYPIDKANPGTCEWAMKKNCGGGKFPITGCAANVQQARHHGPDKNTTSNEKGNVHRICHSCHNRWHTLNDEVYIRDEYILTKHQPIVATVEDLLENEKFWEGRKIVKAKD
jgi:hypothetical protein